LITFAGERNTAGRCSKVHPKVNALAQHVQHTARWTSSSALYDVLVVGGGIIGLATARELIKRCAGSVAVLERETSVGQHQTGHNSGVVHASLYYKVSLERQAFSQ
jgi:glycerol-3-phosphate dehydrogenase